MKISMWMIVEKLKKYRPKYAIVDGSARITGFRFVSSEGGPDFDSRYLYLSLDSDMESAALCNGPDMVILQGRDTNEILNDVLAVFDSYNSWEKALWEASAHKSLQQILDLGDSVLGNPMMLADMDGNVLAMSSAYREEDINEYWIESRSAHRVPTAVLGAPMRAGDGRLASWTEKPAIYVMPDGTRTIGAFLTANGEQLAGFGLWEHRKPITPSDLCLAEVLCQVLLSAVDRQKQTTPVRSSAAILSDLLSGVEIDRALVDKLELRCQGPWRLLMIANPFRFDAVIGRNLLQRLQGAPIPCVPLQYETYVVALVSEGSAGDLLDRLLGETDRKYYQAVLSLPFDELHHIRARYRQCRFSLQSSENVPGVYDGEALAPYYLLSLMKEQEKTERLLHPALNRLKQYDAAHNSELYETLYQYLLHERSILAGAQALHIHKNSFLYRLQKLRALLQVDLDDPVQRSYLLFSCLLDRVQPQGGTKRDAQK